MYTVPSYVTYRTEEDAIYITSELYRNTVRLTDHQRKHITEVHTAFNRFIMVQVPELPRAVSGFPGHGTVIILMSFTKQHIET